MAQDEDVSHLLYSAEELDTERQPLFLATRAGRCLNDVLNEMFLEGELGLQHLQDIPDRFDACMKRVVSARVSKDAKLRVTAQLAEYHDVLPGAVWHCAQGNAALAGAVELPAASIEIRGSF